MKIITAFFMAWGNFLIIPCPYKPWDKEQKNMMLGFLPTIGLVVGGLLLGVTVLLGTLRFPALLSAALVLLLLHGASGYMHLDGFMDVSDAVLSRRPLEDKRRILKDPGIGAFAAISLVMLLVIELTSLITLMSSTFVYSGFGAFIGIPVVSRAVAGLMVLSLKPMEISQYAEGEEENKGSAKAVLILQSIIMVALLLLLAYKWEAMETYGIFRMAVALGATAAGSLIAILYGRKQLEGMNGDIAGYGIAIGEALGLIAMTITL